MEAQLLALCTMICRSLYKRFHPYPVRCAGAVPVPVPVCAQRRELVRSIASTPQHAECDVSE